MAVSKQEVMLTAIEEWLTMFSTGLYLEVTSGKYFFGVIHS
jgi:hypothetical protein